MSGEQRESEVVIVGAGYAGLAAAAAATRAGLDVLLLEARDRVGGRVWTVRSAGGAAIDLGGQWAGVDHDRLRAMAGERDLAFNQGWGDGEIWVETGGRRTDLTARGLLTRPLLAAGVATTLWRLERMVGQVPHGRPWDHADAERLDSMTMDQWLRRVLRMPRARRTVATALGEVLACDMEETSVLATISAMAGAGGLLHAIESEGGSQDSVFKEGADSVARALALELGEKVLLRRSVAAIEAGDTGVVASGAWGEVRARAAIVALPPALAGRIEFRPSLPAVRDRATQRMAMGAVYKAIAVYDERFWRANGMSGDSFRDSGIVRNTFDAAPGSPHAMLGTLVTGSDAIRIGHLTASERRREVTARFAECFGPRAAEPVEFHEKDWTADPLSGGGYCGIPPTGFITAFRDDWNEPVGRIHWAGTETSWRFNGYIEGAIRSGERAAADVASQLS